MSTVEETMVTKYKEKFKNYTTRKNLDEIEQFMRQAFKAIREEERKEIVCKLEDIFQKEWTDDPRSKNGKKQKGTTTWMMGYRTAQKLLRDEVINSLSTDKE